MEEALHRRHIDTRSALDQGSEEDWRRVIDRESAKADGFLFVLEAGGAADGQLRAEWRALLRNDWDSKMPLIPIVKLPGSSPDRLPPFLRNRKAINAANLDDVAEPVEYLLQHPAETVDRECDEEGKAERARRLNELKEYALALKGDSERAERE